MTQGRSLARYSPTTPLSRRTRTMVMRWKVRSGWRRANMSKEDEEERNRPAARDRGTKGIMAKLTRAKPGNVPRSLLFQKKARIASGASMPTQWYQAQL